ncbi:hypothetical protein [Conyzicola sp.]|uniref:hypothetical protein n=1 Tax=Conyzicola sp. TaxID=1969404 RepID=UPI003989C762
MDTSIAGFIVTIALILTAIVSLVRTIRAARLRRRFAADRDDTQRAGTAVEANPYDAAQRAGGSSAWMRPGGGGF